jgi:hypothetical protein
MDSKKSTLERAFDLARSGTCHNVEAIKKRLDREGYAGHQIEGRTLRIQLRALIEKAKNVRAGAEEPRN